MANRAGILIGAPAITKRGERMNREATFERALEEFATAEDVGTVSAVAVAYEVYALRVVAPELAFENLSDDEKQAVLDAANGKPRPE